MTPDIRETNIGPSLFIPMTKTPDEILADYVPALGGDITGITGFVNIPVAKSILGHDDILIPALVDSEVFGIRQQDSRVFMDYRRFCFILLNELARPTAAVHVAKIVSVHKRKEKSAISGTYDEVVKAARAVDAEWDNTERREAMIAHYIRIRSALTCRLMCGNADFDGLRADLQLTCVAPVRNAVEMLRARMSATGSWGRSFSSPVADDTSIAETVELDARSPAQYAYDNWYKPQAEHAVRCLRALGVLEEE
jgi:hypothetical protein